MQHIQQHSHPAGNAGLTEVVLAQENNAQLSMILPMLAHLSRQARDRWVTWIAPRGISRQLLQDYGFDLAKLRLIHTRDDEESLWVLWQALAQGNSDMVVASPGRLSDRALDKLEQAAFDGNCQALLVRYR